MTESYITLDCSDKVQLRVRYNLLAKTDETGEILPHCSGFIHDMLGDLPGEEEIVPITKIDSITMCYIIEFAEMHENHRMKNIQFPLELNGALLMDYIEECDKDFLEKIDFEQLIRLICAIDFLRISDLCILCKARFLFLTKNRSEKEVNELFEPHLNLQIPGENIE